MNNKAQFTPLISEVMAHYNLSDDEWDCLSSFTKQKLSTVYAKHAAAPAMYEALSDAEGMWNIARMIDSKHHAGNPISNDLWGDFHQYLMEWHAKRNAALAQAEGR